MLEEGSFRGRTLDFLWMLVLGATSMIILVPLFDGYLSIPFLSSPLSFMMVYIWSRRNPAIRMNFLGLFTFNAPYLPWVLLGFAVLLNNNFPGGDLLGMGVGHVYYFLEDVYPKMQQAGGVGRRLLATPGWIVWLAEGGMRGDRDAAMIPERWAEMEDVEPEVAEPAAGASALGEEKQAIAEGDRVGVEAKKASAVDAGPSIDTPIIADSKTAPLVAETKIGDQPTKDDEDRIRRRTAVEASSDHLY